MLCTGTIIRNAAEKTNVTLNCPPDAGGSDVPTWSKDGREIQKKKRFSFSPVDKTLTIRHVKLNDSGLYYCDGKPAVYLTVIKGETSDRGERQEVREEQRNMSQISIILMNISQF